MEVANTPESRPEDVLHEMAAGSEEIGARLLRMAGAAAAVHRPAPWTFCWTTTPRSRLKRRLILKQI